MAEYDTIITLSDSTSCYKCSDPSTFRKYIVPQLSTYKF